ncbi:MAG: sigma-54 dependent transcriptional regulator [Bacteroidia bacterium]|nr:sigma-54 dependent transcriptional regulator [Bacteroidia bacterium]MCF8427654.1 sigma-54 dependent transcriptional regulator [Bacteroidia bacterium]MCF8446910.1 sigma-54 dependent transcriptional regulator [Bacteroidia bacterium]
MNLQDIKQRFEIIGNSPLLNIALETAVKVSATDITVLINGESGVGKEAFSKIIHSLSNRKHGPFIAVNCGAIPEGTIDSELFGHEKGSFTGAHDTRKGYFETVSGGTIFLDEIGELPLETQARLLRILESGEFIKVGSSKVQKTDVRIVAATNKDLMELSYKGKFREDLYYRLSTVPIKVPALRDRKEDIHLLFRKFSADFAEKYRSKPVTLEPEALNILQHFSWPGNIRQLKNIAEQLSVLDEDKIVNGPELSRVLPPEKPGLPMLIGNNPPEQHFSERDIFYKVLFDLRKDLSDLKTIVFDMMQGNQGNHSAEQMANFTNSFVREEAPIPSKPSGFVSIPSNPSNHTNSNHPNSNIIDITEASAEPESLSLEHKEIELIRKSLKKHNGKRKKAAQELGISERTLYRKIKQYDLE